MRFTRRQLLACCLALGVIGLVATADPPSKNAAAPAKAPTPSQQIVAVPMPPIPVVNLVPACDMPDPLSLKSPATCVKPLILPTAEPPLAVQLELPKIEVAKVSAKLELPGITPGPVTLPTVTAEPPPPLVLPSPPVIAAPPVVMPKPSPYPDLLPTHSVTLPSPAIPAIPAAPVTVPVLHRIAIDYSRNPIRLEMYGASGTVALLTLECEAVEVRMPGEKDAATTPLKATGRVKFTAPGVSGVCDEFVLYKASGEAVLQGNVKLRCGWNDVMTEVTGTSMKFKLVAGAR